MNSTATDTPATAETSLETTADARYSHTRCSLAAFADRAGSNQFVIENVFADAFGASFKRSDWETVAVEPTNTAPAGQLLFTHPDFNTYSGVIISSTNTPDNSDDIEFDVLKTTADGTELYEIGVDLQTAIMKSGEAARTTLKRTTDHPPNTSGKIRLIADILDLQFEHEYGRLGEFTARLPATTTELHDTLISHINTTELKARDAENTANNTPWSVTVITPNATDEKPYLIVDHDDYTYNTAVVITPNHIETATPTYTVSDTYGETVTDRCTTNDLPSAVNTAMEHAHALQEQCAPRPNVESLIIFENACRT